MEVRINVTIVCHNDHESSNGLCYKLDTCTSWKGKTNLRQRRSLDFSGVITVEEDLTGRVAMSGVTMALVYRCLFHPYDKSLGRTET